MNLHKKSLLQFNNLTVEYGEDKLLDSISGSIVSGGRIGLIGRNGSGKSTLLKCLSALLEPTDGNVLGNSTIRYVPQLDLELYRREIQLHEYLSEHYEDWWQILLSYEKLFGQSLDENQRLATLSGGELVKLGVAVAITSSPEILLLDEPTNHLDLSSLVSLQKLLKEQVHTFVVVSHDIGFLNSVTDTTWELADGKLEVFGGNYDFYRQKKKEKEDATARTYEAKKKEKKKLIASAKRDQERAQRNVKKGEKMHSPGEDKFFKGYFGNKSQKKAGGKKLDLDRKISDIDKKLKALKADDRKKKINLQLKSTRKKGLVISVEDGELKLPGGKVLIRDIDLKIYHGERIAFAGDNGAGKTTLIKQLEYGKNKLIRGEIRYGSRYSSLFVDQKYDLIDPNKTIIENLQSNNRALKYEEIRKLLANLGFPAHQDIRVLAGSLSGGETARLAFAIATSSDIDVLVLDEPTNNLDIETVQIVSDAIRNFQGTVIAVSHNTGFLREIGIEKSYEIGGEKIKEVINN